MNNTLETEQTVADVVRKALKENPQNFTKISAYGLRNLPLDEAKKLGDNISGYILSKPEVLRSLDPE